MMQTAAASDNRFVHEDALSLVLLLALLVVLGVVLVLL